MNCTCFACTGEQIVHTYEIRRRDGETYLYGPGLSGCPHCGKSAAVEMRGPQLPGDAPWTCTCLECKGTWPAKLVETKEVTSL